MSGTQFNSYTLVLRVTLLVEGNNSFPPKRAILPSCCCSHPAHCNQPRQQAPQSQDSARPPADSHLITLCGAAGTEGLSLPCTTVKSFHMEPWHVFSSGFFPVCAPCLAWAGIMSDALLVTVFPCLPFYKNCVTCQVGVQVFFLTVSSAPATCHTPRTCLQK